MTKFGYMRVSTIQQEEYVQRRWLTIKGVDPQHIFGEKKSGKSLAERYQLDELMGLLKKGDELYVYKLDRLSRSTSDALKLMKILRDKGVTLVLGDIGTVEDNELGNLTFTIFAAIAEMERQRILSRTAAGRLYKRENDPNYREGRPYKLTQSQVKELVKRREKETVKELARSYNISMKSVYNYLAKWAREQIPDPFDDIVEQAEKERQKKWEDWLNEEDSSEVN